MTRRTYSVLLEPDTDRGVFTATVPAIPAVVTEGADEAHALAMAREAIGLYLAYAADKGLPIPEEPTAFRLATVEVDAPSLVPAGT